MFLQRLYTYLFLGFGIGGFQDLAELNGLKKYKHLKIRIFVSLFALSVLASVYVFQEFSYYHFLSRFFPYMDRGEPNLVFIVNKTLRLTINDSMCLILIYAFFQEKKYIKMGAYVQMFEMFVILPAYFVVKLSLEGDSEISSPLLSQWHRLIINPTLMILLMVGFYYQKKMYNN